VAISKPRSRLSAIFPLVILFLQSRRQQTRPRDLPPRIARRSDASPEEALFIDDLRENVAAEPLGMTGIHFTCR